MATDYVDAGVAVDNSTLSHLVGSEGCQEAFHAVQRFLQKACLHAMECFATARKAQPLVARELVAQLFDARALEQQLALE